MAAQITALRPLSVDRTSVLGLRRQPGYPRFLSAATLARVADEMFSVGVVLLVLERTDSPSLAGATVAAVTLPSLVTGPLLGAWMDLTGRRRSLMVFDQLAIAASVLGILLLAGEVPDFFLPLIALVAGLTYPLSFGGFTSLIPVLVPDRLLTPANAMEASSFNFALIVGPALAGTLSAAFGPGGVPDRGGGAHAARAGADPGGAGARPRRARPPRTPARCSTSRARGSG